MSEHLNSTQRLMLIGFAFGALTSFAAAQTTVWGLQRHDHFSVETVIERQTTLQLGESPAVTSNLKDNLSFEYTVDNILAGGDVAIQVEVRQASRRTEEPNPSTTSSEARQMALLNKVVVVMIVDQDGIVKGVPGFREALGQLADIEQTSRTVINESVNQGVFASWIGQPFWATIPDEKPEVGGQWERLFEVSLGQLGVLKTIATCEIEDIGDTTTSVKITGNSRHVAPPPTRTNGSIAPLLLTDVAAAMDEFSGTAQIHMAGDAVADVGAQDLPDADDPLQLRAPRKRPPFQSVSLSFECSGEAVVTSGGIRRKLRFQQQQKQTTRLLPGYRIGRQPGLRIFDSPPQ
ncbi:MAG: hypothetical protein R3C59_04620 [Planctomycetaceae bacterium]